MGQHEHWNIMIDMLLKLLMQYKQTKSLVEENTVNVSAYISLTMYKGVYFLTTDTTDAFKSLGLFLSIQQASHTWDEKAIVKDTSNSMYTLNTDTGKMSANKVDSSSQAI